MDPKNPPSYITKQDPELAKKFGKILFEKIKWDALTTKEVMEVYQLFMWYNTLPKKLEDNIIEPTKFTPAPEAPKVAPEKKTPSRKKT